MSKREWDDMKTKGFGAFLFKIYLGLTYPVRHPFITIVVLLAFYRHELSDLWQKYQHQMPGQVQQAALIKKQTTDKIEEKLAEMRSSLGQMMQKLPKEAEKNEQESKDENVRFVSWNVAKFNKAKYEPREENNLKESQTNPTFSETKRLASAERNRKKIENVKEEPYQDVFYKGSLNDYYYKNESLNLEYLPEPEYLYDEVKIAGPNSLYINGKFMYLYGIYSDPAVYDTQEAVKYLEQTSGGHKIHCAVVAETYNHTATALCFVRGVFINKALVDKKLARNVALR